MAFIYADRVKETTTSEGTGNITLAGAYTGYRSFSAGIGVGNTCTYCIDSGAAEWEIGIGTLSAGDTLQRTTVLKSSNGDAAVDFSAGVKSVFVTQVAERILDSTATLGSLADVDTTGAADGNILKRVSGEWVDSIYHVSEDSVTTSFKAYSPYININIAGVDAPATVGNFAGGVTLETGDVPTTTDAYSNTLAITGSTVMLNPPGTIQSGTTLNTQQPSRVYIIAGRAESPITDGGPFAGDKTGVGASVVVEGGFASSTDGNAVGAAGGRLQLRAGAAYSGYGVTAAVSGADVLIQAGPPNGSIVFNTGAELAAGEMGPLAPLGENSIAIKGTGAIEINSDEGTAGQVLTSGGAGQPVTWEDPAAASVAWGDITGTLSNQTDLNSALGGKADASHSHAISDVTNLQTELDLKGYKNWKAPVRGATTANITLSGTPVIDGLTPAAGQRWLVKNQDTASENGIYVVAAGAWSRATDDDVSARGQVVPVSFGSANANTFWVLSSTTPIVFTDITPVKSVAGKTGAVTLTKSDVGLANVDNTSDANKPVSTAQQAALDTKRSLHGWPLDENGDYQVTLAYNPVSRTVTITAVSGSTFDVYVKGVKVTTASPFTSAAHAATEGGWFFYHDGSNWVWSQTPWDMTIVSPTCYAYYSSAVGSGVGVFELHTAERNAEWHQWAHVSTGTVLNSGGLLGDYTLATDTNAATQFSISETKIADEDIEWTCAAKADGGPYTIWYRSGTGWTWTTRRPTSGPC